MDQILPHPRPITNILTKAYDSLREKSIVKVTESHPEHRQPIIFKYEGTVLFLPTPNI